VPLCEQFIKTVVCELFLGSQAAHRNVKIETFKLIQIMSSFFDVVQILRLDNEPNIVKDILDVLVQDSQDPMDLELSICAFKLINSNLLSVNEKLDFLKQNEQWILQSLKTREIDVQ
jgi:hypothetical protein